MERRELGKTGFFITPLCVGTAALGNMPDAYGFKIIEEQARQTITAALQSEINFMDTAANYSEAEARIGRAIRVLRESGELKGLQKGFLLQTKVDANPITGDYSGEQVRKCLLISIDLLRVDHFPIIYLHDVEFFKFKEVMGKDGAFKMLQNFQDEGVIDHIGVSGGPVSVLMDYVATGAFSAVITAGRYTVLHRQAEELIDFAHSKRMGILNASPFGGGLLADPKNNWYSYGPALPEVIARASRFRRICQEYGADPKAVALQFSTRDPRITSTIIGATTPEQLKEDIKLLNEKVPEEIWPEFDKLVIRNESPEIVVYRRLGLRFND